MTDASDIAIGAVLKQHLEGKWCPLSYFSGKLSPAEQWYSTFDRELLAVCSSICHFRHLLEGREFYALVDHKPLTDSLNTIVVIVLHCMLHRHSPRQVWKLDFIPNLLVTFLTLQENGAQLLVLFHVLEKIQLR